MVKAFVIHIALLIAALGMSGNVRAADENTVQAWADQYLKHSKGNVSLIQVTSELKFDNNNPVIAFRLVNSSELTLRTYPFALPWGDPNAVSLVAIRADKTFLKLVYPFYHPRPESKIEIAPGEALEGEYNLGWRLQLSESDRRQDIIVLWSYSKNLGGTPLSQAFATGAVVIPRIR